MEKSKSYGFTPEPWTVEDDKTTVTMAGQCVIVAPAPDGASQAECRANAALICAAPDMLSALIDLLTDIDDQGVVTQASINHAARAIEQATKRGRK
jgi:hypothetical protein